MVSRLSYVVLVLAAGLLTACETMTPTEKIDMIRAGEMPRLEKEMAKAELVPGAPTFFRIFKNEGVLEAWVRSEQTRQYHLYKTYNICRWSGDLGPKKKEGDKQAPEGFYAVTPDWMWPGSKYHLAMNIGYPNAYDRAHNRTGSYIMIHGRCWSEGCFAMTDGYIEEIYLLAEAALLAGNHDVPVHIFPFRMTRENMAFYANSEWMPFWENLKEGYDIFESTRVPPEARVKNGRYTFIEREFISGGNV